MYSSGSRCSRSRRSGSSSQLFTETCFAKGEAATVFQAMSPSPQVVLDLVPTTGCVKSSFETMGIDLTSEHDRESACRPDRYLPSNFCVAVRASSGTAV